MKIILIAALDQKRVIGKNNKLPWKLPDDLKRFRQLTSGHPVVMGRKTFESLGKPLPNRTNIVLTRNIDALRSKLPPDVWVESDPKVLLQKLEKKFPNEDVYVIGGEEIYRLFLAYADELNLTLIEREFDGDAYFPVFSKEDFTEVSRENKSHEGMPYSYVLFRRSASETSPGRT